MVKTKPPEFKICFDDDYINKYFLVRLKKIWFGLSHTYKMVTELVDFTGTIGFKEMPHRFKTQKQAKSHAAFIMASERLAKDKNKSSIKVVEELYL